LAQRDLGNQSRLVSGPDAVSCSTRFLGAVATEGGVFPNAWNKFVPKPDYSPAASRMWNETTWPARVSLSQCRDVISLASFLKDGRANSTPTSPASINPVWTNPDGFSWIEALTDKKLIGC